MKLYIQAIILNNNNSLYSRTKKIPMILFIFLKANAAIKPSTCRAK